MAAVMVNELTDAAVVARRLITVARSTAGRGSLPSTANVLAGIATALGTALSTVLESGALPSDSGPSSAPTGFTVVDRSLTRC